MIGGTTTCGCVQHVQTAYYCVVAAGSKPTTNAIPSSLQASKLKSKPHSDHLIDTHPQDRTPTIYGRIDERHQLC